MVTKSGEQCSREAVSGGMGFCWQHVLTERAIDRSKWKDRMESAALVVSATELIIKLIELAVTHLPEFFGTGDEQTEAKQTLRDELEVFSWETLPDILDVGCRVDWKQLLSVYNVVKNIQKGSNDAKSDVAYLEKLFDDWFSQMNSFHQKELLIAIESSMCDDNAIS